MCFTVSWQQNENRERKRYIRENGLSEYIEFIGNIDNPAEFYADQDVTLLSSKNEGTPLRIVETPLFGY